MDKPKSPANTLSQDVQILEASFIADNSLRVGLKIDTSMEFGFQPGASYGLYSIARGYGEVGSYGMQVLVGVHATCVKQNGTSWAAALHADVYDTEPGGTSIGLNIEFPRTTYGTATYGVNMQPHVGAKDLVGMQIQLPECFKYSLKLPNMSQVFGQVDDCYFGMRFNVERQSLEFFRAIGQPGETKVGEIKMDFGQARPADQWK